MTQKSPANYEITKPLRDVMDASAKPLKVTVKLDALYVLVRPEGYGDKPSDDGDGWPVLIENRNGVPHVVIWADINQEDPTHVISLDEAAESNRKEEEDA
jgi:hypothetical protein